jgi:hypothetical protein
MKGYTVEIILAWAFLFVGLISQDPDYFTASGVFAVAVQIGMSRKKRGGEG